MGQRLQGGLFFRGCAQVLRIDGATGAVEWKLGGTAAPDGSTTEFLELVEHSDPSVVEEFCGQHHVTHTSSGTQAEYLREYRLPDAHCPFTHDGGRQRPVVRPSVHTRSRPGHPGPSPDDIASQHIEVVVAMQHRYAGTDRDGSDQAVSRRTVSSSRRQREWGDSRLDAATPVGDGEPVSAAAIAIAGVGVALPAVLVPLILTLHGRVVAELGELRRDLHAIAERVARIEGALTGPWRPTNGSPAPASKTPPEATAE